MKPLKEIYFQEAFISQLASSIAKETPDFAHESFRVKLLSERYGQLALKDKLRQCALVMGECLELDYLEALEILKKVAPNFGGFEGLVFPEYVDVYGQDYFEASLEALSYFTMFGSSEFAIRSYANKDLGKVFELMRGLSKSENEDQRRFASEGIRPKLPWAKGIELIKDDDSLIEIIKILEVLKEDEALYVRKSVANNLNDISKIDPDLVIKTAKAWIGKNDHTDWILKHGLRTLLKKGNKQALKLWQVDDSDGVEIESFYLEESGLYIGDSTYLHVTFTVEKTKRVRGAFNVHYLKKNGTYSLKSFAFFDKEYQAGSYTLKKKVSFKQMSTRTHYAGRHMIDMIVNGDQKGRISFCLSAEKMD